MTALINNLEERDTQPDFHSVPHTRRVTTFASQDDVISTSGERSRAASAYRRARSAQTSPNYGSRGGSSGIKRLLLTRKYRDHNIYNDIGVRVVGGKRMENGELGAFVSAVSNARHTQTLGQISQGDQVLEWNGVLLTGKTFEEVERVVNASSGEIELVIKARRSCPSSLSSQAVLSNGVRDYMTAEEMGGRLYDSLPSRSAHTRDSSPEKPPVPMHRSNGGLLDAASPVFDIFPPVNGYLPSGTFSSGNASESLGHLQLALVYEHASARLIVRVVSARGLKRRDSARGHAPPNPFVKIYLLPGRKVSHKRRTRFVPSSVDPEWNQMVEYDVAYTALQRMCLELTIWDYDKFSENNSLGQVVISLADNTVLTGAPRWYRVEPLAQPGGSNNNGSMHRRCSHHTTLARDCNGGLVYREQPPAGGVANGRLAYNYTPAALDIGYPAIK